MRTYEKTHPWLTFRLDLRRVPAHLWVRLGECQSKCQHISNVPLKVATASRLYQLFLAKGSLGSAAIEGNTLTEEEVVRHLEGRLALPPSREYLAREVDNIVSLCQEVTDQIAGGQALVLSRWRIQDINRRILKDIPVEPGVIPGEIRKTTVGVARYRGAPAEDCEHLLDRLCSWIESPELNPKDEDVRLAFAILKAIIAHLYFEWIHPFGDGNGRTGRMIEFSLLVASGVPAPAAHLMSNHYNLTRDEYDRQLDAASRSGGDVIPFIDYAVRGLLDGLREPLHMIWQQQWDIAWRDFLYEHSAFRDKDSEVARRQRALILDLSTTEKATPMKAIPELTPRLSRLYATVSERTLSRDLAVLEREKLIENTGAGYRARKEVILAFRPPTAGALSRTSGAADDAP
ncbi:MAG: hypothetical protein FLDDKLPJ_03049 [Phycisphaerae bacterium]|nr:hypothetical protein [Phycisphaerae bacterium]